MSREEEEKRNLISAAAATDDDDAVPSDYDSDFEFTVCSGSGSPPEPHDPVYPVFDRNLLLVPPPPPKSDLRSGSASSSSSSVADEEEKYCVWVPKKSSSTGSAAGSPSRRFRLRDLVSRRSHSDGKEKLGFMGDHREKEKERERVPKANPNPNPNLKGEKKKKDLKPGEMDLLTAHRLFYGGKDGEKGVKGGKAYLPPRSGPVGLFANGNGLSRTKFPF